MRGTGLPIRQKSRGRSPQDVVDGPVTQFYEAGYAPMRWIPISYAWRPLLLFSRGYWDIVGLEKVRDWVSAGSHNKSGAPVGAAASTLGLLAAVALPARGVDCGRLLRGRQDGSDCQTGRRPKLDRYGEKLRAGEGGEGPD